VAEVMMIMRIFAFCALAGAAQAAQSVTPTQHAPRKDSTVHVRGCLQGQTLTLTEDPGFEVAGRTINLKGDRRMMRALREHNGHLEDIAGALKTQGDSVVAMKEKRGKKTRVYVGVSESRPTTMENAAAAPVLEVRAFSHIGPSCR
jgi:hypothetical protein